MVGNPNVGKTALLNALTSGSFIVGNYPGTTVEIKRGKAKINGKEIEFIDLPGIYSLKGYAEDERIVKEYFEREKPDLILNVINSTSIERGLYITLRVMQFRIPMVIALNMIDEAEKRGIEIDEKRLSEILGVPVVKTVAIGNIGIDKLKEEILKGGKVGKLRINGDELEIVKKAEEISSQVVIKRRDIELPILDVVLTDPYLSIPIFFVVMWILFRFTYDVATPIVDFLDLIFSELADFISSKGGIFELIGNGVVKGVGSVLVFLPNIAFLFIGVAFLELSGYLPRAVFALDKVMLKFGLSGRSVVPMILGFGCNVPAVMATRTIEDRRTRVLTILIVPFISCSARLPIYVLFTAVFFPGFESFVIMVLYTLGIAIALLSAIVLRKVVFKGEPEFIMEIPPLRVPRLRDIWILTWSRTKHFLVKAGTIIFAMSIVVWFLTSYPSENIANSYAAMLGKAIAPIFAPFGWDWRAVIALIMGLVAKEVVVETFGILLGNARNVIDIMSTPQAFAFLVFTLLYVPCMATVATIKAETNWKYAVFSVVYSIVVAYVFALIAFEVLKLLI